MKKVLITGGSGTIGRAFIKEYSDKYEFYNYSRNEKNIFELSKDFPNTKSIIGDILDLPKLIKTFQDIKPDIVIHSAALKHIDIAEKNPTESIKLNVIGSYNIISAAVLADVKLVVGVSTDKACEPKSVYGYTKKLMEEMFIDSYTERNKFVCTRFANVAGSNGSVIPYWKKLVENGEKLKLTDPDMNRLMFSKQDAAKLIHRAIELSEERNTSFVLSKKMKSVNLFQLAKTMSKNEIEIVGKRPGEKLNEELISISELPFTELLDDYILISKTKKVSGNQLFYEYSSITAEKASVEEIKNLIES